MFLMGSGRDHIESNWKNMLLQDVANHTEFQFPSLSKKGDTDGLTKIIDITN